MRYGIDRSGLWVRGDLVCMPWWSRHLRCKHRSHGLRLPCWRHFTYDSMCGKHNDYRCNPPTGREDYACAFWKRAVRERTPA